MIARLAGVRPRSVVFTSGATESNAIAIQGRVKQCVSEGMPYQEMHILYLPTMHASSLGAITELSRHGVVVEELPLIGGVIDTERFQKLIRSGTVLVCTDAVCGETGMRFDTLRLKRALEASQSKARLHVDASQLPLVEPIERTRLGADLLVLDSQKVGGIRGVGALIVPQHKLIAPILQGGGQEGGLRPGTEPVALIAAFAEALAVCAERCATFATSAITERTRLIDSIIETIPEAVVHDAKRQAPHILNISLPGLVTDYMVALLDRDGFAVSTRSACETDSQEGSKAVLLRTGDPVLAASTLRISWGPSTRPSELHRLAKALAVVTAFLKGQ
jgi:cysteine desulfurase